MTGDGLPPLHVLMLDGIPRTCLTPKEVEHVTGIPYRHILDAIEAGRVKVITGGRSYILPPSSESLVP